MVVSRAKCNARKGSVDGAKTIYSKGKQVNRLERKSADNVRTTIPEAKNQNWV